MSYIVSFIQQVHLGTDFFLWQEMARRLATELNMGVGEGVGGGGSARPPPPAAVRTAAPMVAPTAHVAQVAEKK
jgi:hypothetical protein